MAKELSEIGFEYIKLCDEIKQFNDSLKMKREEQKQLKSKLLKNMAENNIPEISLPNGTIYLDKKDNNEAINKKSISKSLESHYNENDVEKIVNLVLQNRPKKIIHKIRVDS